jgi:hypothetical protein
MWMEYVIKTPLTYLMYPCQTDARSTLRNGRSVPLRSFLPESGTVDALSWKALF